MLSPRSLPFFSTAFAWVYGKFGGFSFERSAPEKFQRLDGNGEERRNHSRARGQYQAQRRIVGDLREDHGTVDNGVGRAHRGPAGPHGRKSIASPGPRRRARGARG